MKGDVTVPWICNRPPRGESVCWVAGNSLVTLSVVSQWQRRLKNAEINLCHSAKCLSGQHTGRIPPVFGSIRMLPLSVFFFCGWIYTFLISHFHFFPHIDPCCTVGELCEWIKPPSKHTANVAFRHQRRDQWQETGRVNSFDGCVYWGQSIGVREACWNKGCEPQSIQRLSSFAHFINGLACSCQWE